jgi:hypothetical protein
MNVIQDVTHYNRGTRGFGKRQIECDDMNKSFICM